MHATQPHREPWQDEWADACARRGLSQGALRLLRLLYDLAGDREQLEVAWTAIVHELRRSDATVRGWRAALDDCGIIEVHWNLGPRGGTSRQPGRDLIAIRLHRRDHWRPEQAPAWLRRREDPQPRLPFPEDAAAPALRLAEPPEVARDLARPVDDPPSPPPDRTPEENGDLARDKSRDLTRATYLARTFTPAGGSPEASPGPDTAAADAPPAPGQGDGDAQSPSASQRREACASSTHQRSNSKIKSINQAEPARNVAIRCVRPAPPEPAPTPMAAAVAACLTAAVDRFDAATGPTAQYERLLGRILADVPLPAGSRWIAERLARLVVLGQGTMALPEAVVDKAILAFRARAQDRDLAPLEKPAAYFQSVVQDLVGRAGFEWCADGRERQRE